MDCIVEMEDISKSFPGVKALDNVSFNLKSGEVHALIGENGAGKSTLMKVLSGIYPRDNGSIKVFGEEIEHMSTKRASELGISIIHQELNMCSHLSVMENIFLGREKTSKGFLSKKVMREKTIEILKELDIDISPDTIVSSLPVSMQQMIEISKAISVNAKVLIMDEPTSALTKKEIDKLFSIINKLKKKGCGIVYISHRMEEFQYIVDRVTVMRDGEYIVTKNFKETSIEEIISFMVGREIKEKFPRTFCPKGDLIFSVKNLNAGPLVRDINFDVFKGEIVGIAGLMGAGRTEMSRAIFGVDAKESGGIFLEGEEIQISSPKDAIDSGIVLVPEDRKKDGLCTKLSVSENISLTNLDDISSTGGLIKEAKERSLVSGVIKKLGIKVSSPSVNAETLSGGNQQKIVIGKWLARDSKVIIFDEPTRGIDVAAKVEIYNLMNKLKEEGIGVVFISSELPEILGISDRVLVMCDGKITKDLVTQETSQDEILTYATKFESKI